MTKQSNKSNTQSNVAKRNARSHETPSIVLKTIHDDIMRDNKNATITTKKMRVRLRATMRDVHVANASWIFTRSQYDVVRSMFDDAYAQRISRAAKRANAQSKRVTKSNVVDVVADANENA